MARLTDDEYNDALAQIDDIHHDILWLTEGYSDQTISGAQRRKLSDAARSAESALYLWRRQLEGRVG